MSEFGLGFTSTMPTPPARLTSKLLSMRALTPRSHTTILPVALAGSSVPAMHSFASGAAAPANFALSAVTSGLAVFSGGVVEAPTYRAPLPSSTAWKARRNVAAATVVTHGAGWSRVLAPGPLLPAEFATKTPALDAARNAIATESRTEDSDEPPIEKLRMSTPSRTASLIAATLSELKHPAAMPGLPVQHTL